MHYRYLMMALLISLFLTLVAGVSYAETASRNGYIGVVAKSENHKSGEQFTFANLQSEKPIVTFPSGYAGEVTKVFEDDDVMVLIFVAYITGSTETFYLNKKQNRFTLIEVTTLKSSETSGDFPPIVTYGKLK